MTVALDHLTIDLSYCRSPIISRRQQSQLPACSYLYVCRLGQPSQFTLFPTGYPRQPGYSGMTGPNYPGGPSMGSPLNPMSGQGGGGAYSGMPPGRMGPGQMGSRPYGPGMSPNMGGIPPQVASGMCPPPGMNRKPQDPTSAGMHPGPSNSIHR